MPTIAAADPQTRARPKSNVRNPCTCKNVPQKRRTFATVVLHDHDLKAELGQCVRLPKVRPEPTFSSHPATSRVKSHTCQEHSVCSDPRRPCKKTFPVCATTILRRCFSIRKAVDVSSVAPNMVQRSQSNLGSVSGWRIADTRCRSSARHVFP